MSVLSETSAKSRSDRSRGNRSAIRKRLRHGGLWVFVGRSLGMVTMFLIVAYLARRLATEAFASYVVTASLVTLAGVFGTLGLNQLVCRRTAQFIAWGDWESAKKSTRQLTLLGLATSLSTAALFLCLSPILARVLNCPSLAVHSVPIAAWIVLLAFSQIIAEAFRGIHDLRAASLLAGISGGLLANFQLLVAIVVLDLCGTMTYSSTIGAAVGSFAIPAIGGGLWLIVRWVKAPAASPSAALTDANDGMRKSSDSRTLAVLAQAIPIMLVNLIALGFDQAGQLIAQYSGTSADVAAFEAVWRVAMIGIVPLTMLGLAVASTMAEMHSLSRTTDLEKLVRGVSTLSTIVTVPVLILMIVFAGPVLTVIFGPNYSVGTVALVAIGLVQIVRNWAGPCDTLLIMTGHQRAAFASFVLATPILALGPYAVSRYGVTGIGVVIAGAILTSRLFQYAAVRKYLRLKPHADFHPTFLRSVVKFLFAPRSLAASS